MALVYGFEPTPRTYFTNLNRASATKETMASPKATRGKSVESQVGITNTNPKSSPPINIPKQTAPPIITPPNSFGEEPKTPGLMRARGEHVSKSASLLTPGDEMPEKANRKADPMLQELLESSFLRKKTKRVLRGGVDGRWQGLDEDVLMDLRSYSSHALALPFRVDAESFREWDRLLPEVRGYEYDAGKKQIIILMLPGAVHEAITMEFIKWFIDIERDLAKQKVEMNVRGTQAVRLRGRHHGKKKEPDCGVQIDGVFKVVVEVGVSQDLPSLIKAAKRWLLGKGAELVILVDVSVKEIDPDNLDKTSFNSIEIDRGYQPTLPYGLVMDDLRDLDTTERKITEWYRLNKPLEDIVQAQTITIHLYRRHPTTHSAIQSESPIIIYDIGTGGFSNATASIQANDFGISQDLVQGALLELPLGMFRAKLDSWLDEHSKEVVARRAEDLISRHVGLNEDYSDSSLPLDEDPRPATSPCKTRSSSKEENNVASFQQQPSTGSKRKQDTQSFTSESARATSEDASDNETDFAYTGPNSFSQSQARNKRRSRQSQSSIGECQVDDGQLPGSQPARRGGGGGKRRRGK